MPAGAREAFSQTRQIAVNEGAEYRLTYVGRYLAMLEIRARRWAEASRLIDEYADMAGRYRLPGFLDRAALDRAKVAAYQGETTLARTVGAESVEQGVATQSLMLEQVGHGLLGLAAYLDGDMVLAARELDAWSEIFQVAKAGDPGLREFAGEHIEALILTGRYDSATETIDQLIALAEPLGRTSVLAAAARGRALLLADLGDLGRRTRRGRTRAVALRRD